MNKGNKENKFLEKIYLLPYLSYSAITFYVWYKTKFDLIQFIPDFDFYFNYAYGFWGDFNSDLANRILDALGGNIFIRGDWQPAPLYPILFLSPINILGSKYIFAFEGFLIGLGCIYFFRKILEKFNNEINEKIKYLSLLAFSLSPVILTNTIALSTNGVWGFLLLIAITYSKNFSIRTFALILASIVRPNFVLIIFIFLICYFKSLIPRRNDIKLTFFLVLASYTLFYLLYHKNYPGNFVNYFLLSSGQGFELFGEYGKDFISKTLNLKFQLLEADLDLKSIFNVLKTPEGINYIFQLIFLKINAILGYTSQGLYETRGVDSFWFSKILRSIYYFFFFMPGFLITLKLSFSILLNNIISESKKINFFILACCLYITLSSLLIAVPRYLFPFDMVLIVVSITFWNRKIMLNKKVY